MNQPASMKYLCKNGIVFCNQKCGRLFTQCKKHLLTILGKTNNQTRNSGRNRHQYFPKLHVKGRYQIFTGQVADPDPEGTLAGRNPFDAETLTLPFEPDLRIWTGLFFYAGGGTEQPLDTVLHLGTPETFAVGSAGDYFLDMFELGIPALSRSW